MSVPASCCPARAKLIETASGDRRGSKVESFQSFCKLPFSDPACVGRRLSIWGFPFESFVWYQAVVSDGFGAQDRGCGLLHDSRGPLDMLAHPPFPLRTTRPGEILMRVIHLRDAFVRSTAASDMFRPLSEAWALRLLVTAGFFCELATWQPTPGASRNCMEAPENGFFTVLPTPENQKLLARTGTRNSSRTPPSDISLDSKKASFLQDRLIKVVYEGP